MVELVDTPDSKSGSARSAGSIPARGTTHFLTLLCRRIWLHWRRLLLQPALYHFEAAKEEQACKYQQRNSYEWPENNPCDCHGDEAEDQRHNTCDQPDACAQNITDKRYYIAKDTDWPENEAETYPHADKCSKAD